MRVYLVQHGESKSEEEDPQRRFDRQRNRRGTKGCQFFAYVEACARCRLAQWQSTHAADRRTARGGGRGSGSSTRIESHADTSSPMFP
jgi:hypothetical protein